MARYTLESVERVKDRLDMEDLVGSRTELRRTGASSFMALCPFHDERSPSFSVDPVKKVFYCFGCGENGSGVDFVMKTEGVDFKTAIELLADRYGIELEMEEEDPREAERRKWQARLYEVLERTAAYYERVLWESPEAAPAREYLAGRGLSEEALREFRVGYSPAAWDRVVVASQKAGYSDGVLNAAGLLGKNRTDRFRERIMFPLCDTRGRVIGFGARAMAGGRPPKYLNTSESELFHKGRQVYGAHLARAAAAKAGTLIVTEGYTDVIALRQAGFQNVVCVMGTAITEDQIRALRRLAPVAHLALDADNAGQEAMLRAARVAGSENLELRVLPVPEGLDPAELVQRDGADGVRALVEKSMPFVRFRVLRALAKGDLLSAEGKDRVLDEIRPVFAQLPASVLRQELLRTVSDRLDVPADLVEDLLRRPASRPPAPPRQSPRPAPSPSRPAADPYARDPGRDESAPPPDMSWIEEDEDPGRFGPPPAASRDFSGSHRDTRGSGDRRDFSRGGQRGGRGDFRGGPRRDFSAPDPRRAEPSVASILARTEEAERRFLQFCIAMPGHGNEALKALDVDESFTSALTRRAALHLREHLHAPLDGIADDDEELTTLLRELLARNAMEPPTPATFDTQRLQLEIRRVRRRMQRVREAGEEGATALAAQLQTLQEEFDKAMERAVETG